MRCVLFALLVAPLAAARGQTNAPVHVYVPTVDHRNVVGTLEAALQAYLFTSDPEFATFVQPRPYSTSRSLIQALASDPVDDRLTFVFCVPDSCDALVVDPQGKSLIEELQLKVMNARLSTLPLYLFTRTDRTIAADSIRVGYYVPPDHRFAETDLRQVIQANYRGARTIALHGHADGTLMAQAFWSSDPSYDVIAIYDEEPSPILDEMLREIDYRRAQTNDQSEKSRKASLWPIYLESDASRLYRPSAERFQADYVVVELGDRTFLSDSAFRVRNLPDTTAAVLAFRRRELRSADVEASGTPGFEEFFPVILTNAIILGWSNERMLELREALSDSYFSVLEQLRNADRARRASSTDWSSLPPRKRTVARTFLLNSHFDDPANRYRILALREYDTITDLKRARLERDWLCSLGLRPEPSFRELAEWLGLPDVTTGSSLRHEFNGSPIGPLRKAEEILSAPAPIYTIEELRRARSSIIDALELSTASGTYTLTTGLWKWPYNPFYLLARIEASLSDGEPRDVQVSNPCEN